MPINDGVPHGALLLWSPCRTFHEHSGWLTDLGLKETDACSPAGFHSGSGAGWLSHLSTRETEAGGLSVWGSQGERALGQEELSLGWSLTQSFRRLSSQNDLPESLYLHTAVSLRIC